VVCQLYSEDASTFHFLWSSQSQPVTQPDEFHQSAIRRAASEPPRSGADGSAERAGSGDLTYLGWFQLTTCSTGRKYQPDFLFPKWVLFGVMLEGKT